MKKQHVTSGNSIVAGEDSAVLRHPGATKATLLRYCSHNIAYPMFGIRRARGGECTQLTSDLSPWTSSAGKRPFGLHLSL